MSDVQSTETIELSAIQTESLLRLARGVIDAALTGDDSYAAPLDPSVDERLADPRGCFVTLHKKGMLRGCIGTIEPVMPLISCVRGNALNAAFHDHRFPPLTKEELDDIDIEISILTRPVEVIFADPQELLCQLLPREHGVILASGRRRATFLPQVWEQLPDKEQFLNQLCLKAGMRSGCWKDKKIAVFVYKVSYFSEHRG